MTTWVLEPRDTLIIRDGRPIQEGSPPMRSLDFPWPSTIAGLVRTRIGISKSGRFELPIAEARRIAVRGPLLAQLAQDGAVDDYLLPAPRDSVWHRPDEGPLQRRRLTPQRLPSGCATDLGSDRVVGLAGEVPKGKAAPGPVFWRWEHLKQWLLAPLPPGQADMPDATFGHGPFVHERRTHVAIEPGSQTAGDGQLFSTDGLRFAVRSPQHEERLGITFLCEDGRLLGGGVQCGGERRLSFLRQAKSVWPAFPKELRIAAGQWARVVLLTPALFDLGFAPAQVKGARVVACAVPRAEVLSGWDLEYNGPKPTRLMAPAGSVYWVEIRKDQDAQRWAQEVWMQCISDQEQDRLDGFGLCVVGVA